MFLLAVLSLPLAAPLFALTPKSEADLPACCRKGGKHHCMMSMAERGKMVDGVHRFGALPERCPYSPLAASRVHHQGGLDIASAQQIFAGLAGSDGAVLQTQCWMRISRDRSRHKRGPPTPRAAI